MDKHQQYELAEKLYQQQNFMAAVIAGVVTMLLGCGIYAVVAIALEGQSVSVVYIVIGALIGLAMQFLGRGVTGKFTLAAALIAFAGYPAARFVTIALYTRTTGLVSPVGILDGSRTVQMGGWALAGIDLLNAIFWLVAIGTAAFFAKRRLSRDEDFAMHAYRHRPASESDQ